MSASDENLPGIDPILLDQLVDGELPDAERRRLLEQLDRAPGGWRACALAFLEAQCWRESVRPARGKPEPRRPTERPRPWPRRQGPLATALAMAASFLVALGLGVVIRATWFSRPPIRPGGAEIAGVAPRAETPGPTVGPAPGGPSRGMEEGPPGRAWQPEAAPNRPLQTVQVSLHGPDGRAADAIELPVTEREGLDDSWFRPAPVPPEVREMFRRMGCEVEPSRSLLPAPIDDGRRLVVPVDEWNIRYVGNRSFQ